MARPISVGERGKDDRLSPPFPPPPSCSPTGRCRVEKTSPGFLPPLPLFPFFVDALAKIGQLRDVAQMCRYFFFFSLFFPFLCPFFLPWIMIPIPSLVSTSSEEHVRWLSPSSPFFFPFPPFPSRFPISGRQLDSKILGPSFFSLFPPPLPRHSRIS